MTKGTKISVIIFVTMTIYMISVVYDMNDKLSSVTFHVEGVTNISVTMTKIDDKSVTMTRVTDLNGYADMGYVPKGTYYLEINNASLCSGMEWVIRLTEHIETVRVGIMQDSCYIDQN